MQLLKPTLLLTATLLPLVTAATGELGFALGVKRNKDGGCKTTSEFEWDLDVIAKNTGARVIRTYAVSDCNTMQNIMPAVEKKGFKIVLGVWPNDDAHFADELKALKTYIPKYGTDNIKAITIGSEALYREDMTGKELASRINTVRETLADLGADNIPLGFADSWNMFLEGEAVPVVEASNFILANAFSYWQAQKMDNATRSFYDDIMQALTRIQDLKGSNDFEFWVGETNWPSQGAAFKDEKTGRTGDPGSVQNQQKYWKEGICSIVNWGINVFVFSAFDEHWKPAEKDNSVENHWGVFTDEGKPKFDMSC